MAHVTLIYFILSQLFTAHTLPHLLFTGNLLMLTLPSLTKVTQSMKKLSTGLASILLAAITLLTACNGAGGSSSAPAASSAANSTDSSSVYSSGDFSASDRLISNTGTGGGNKEDTNTSSDRVEESDIVDSTSNEGNTSSNATTMTPTEEDSNQTIDTSKIEQGDYTAGGYASTTADSRYKDNGIVVGWATNIGVKFDRTQIQDLYNFVKSGYTSARTVDARIQSRKGGTDNPRIAWFESYEMGKDNVFVSGYDDGYVGNTISVTYENMTCSDKLLELLKKPKVIDADGDGAFESSTKNWDALLKLNETEDVEKEICAKPEYTSITYNFRNYCGDVIRVGIRGPNVNSYSS